MRAYERLLEYVKIPSAANERCPDCPSAPGIWEMGRTLEKEMRAMGLSDVELDGNCYLTATVPATAEGAPVLGFVAHMDVSPASPCEGVKPRIIENYDGSDIIISKARNLVTRVADFPALARSRGKDLIVTDGSTLLGADDKAGVAEILTMAELLLADKNIKHGKIRLAFTPDEEIGRGVDHFDVAKFGADYAYTVDGGPFGEISCENFNASAAKVSFTGRSVHPGSAKNIMINAQVAAAEFFDLLPADERPEHTEGREGFYMLDESRGSIEKAEQSYILRDHDAAKLAVREETIRKAADAVNAKYGAGTVTVDIKEQYRNMYEIISKYPFMLEIAKQAVRDCGGEPLIEPIRGGTDGAMLSFKGLPCPNLGTGSGNHHGRQEFACVQDMDKVSEQLVKIAEAYGRLKRKN